MATPVVNPIIHDIFERNTSTWQYIVADPSSRVAVIIDPVLDFDPSSGKAGTVSADHLLEIVQRNCYTVDMILETHVHADHLTAASYLREKLVDQGRKPHIGIGGHIRKVQQHFAAQFGVPQDELDSAFDRFLDDGETFSVGQLPGEAIHLPGHTPDHMGYRIGENIFVGDSLFNPDVGTARCDFPFGSAQNLYQSGTKLLSFPEHFRIWVGHDYPPASGARIQPLSSVTVKEQRAINKHLKFGTTEAEFVDMREARDSQLSEPKLLRAAVQVNIRGGKLPRSLQTVDSSFPLLADRTLASIRL